MNNNQISDDLFKAAWQQVVAELDDKFLLSCNNDLHNETICNLLGSQLNDFFNDINIPFEIFQQQYFDVKKILRKNKEALFYISEYTTKEIQLLFDKVFSKYISEIEKIFYPKSVLHLYLQKWKNEDDQQITNNSYLKKLLNSDKYNYMSPLHITNVYIKNLQKHNGNKKLTRIETLKKLNFDKSNISTEIKKFKHIYDNLISDYVCYKKLNDNNAVTRYTRKFISDIIHVILIFTDKLLSCNVYSVHTIINYIIDFYLPLDELKEKVYVI